MNRLLPSRSQLTFEDLRGLRAEGYVRDSTLDQRDGFGPEIQRHNIQRFAQSYGVLLGNQWYTDFVSGRSASNRLEFQRLLEDAQLDRFDALLVDHTSRFGRNQAECIRFKEELRRLDKVIVFVSQGIISGTDRDFLSERINETLDEQYSRNLSRYVISGMAEKAAHGYANGLPPLGYISEILSGRKGERKVPDPETVPILTALLRDYASGEFSFRDVADRLNAKGFRTRYGNVFTGHTVKDVLSNRFYEGKVVFHSGQVDEEVQDGLHPVPLEVKTLWLRCQETKRERSIATAGRPRGPKRHFPFSRVLSCQRCEHPYHGEAVKRGEETELRITHERRGPGRECDAWPRSGSVSSLVAQFAERVISHMHLTGEWKAAVQNVLRQERSTEGDERQSESIKRALENLRKQHLWGDLVDDEYRRERAALERQLRSIHPPLRSPQLPNLERAAQLLTDLPGLWLHPGVSHEQRENLVREVFKGITIDGTRFMTIKPRPVYVPLFATMLLESNVDYCGREPPPSPPETRRAILRARKLVRGIFFVEDHATAFTGSGYVKEGLKGRFGPEGHNGLFLYSVDVDPVQHGYQNLPTLCKIRFLP